MTTNIETFYDAFVGAIICSHKQGKWKLNLPVIAATGESLGISEAEINPGGRHYDEIIRRVGAATAGGSGRDARSTAESCFGPQGEVAPNFMKRSAWRI
jgi:hypothetical protein